MQRLRLTYAVDFPLHYTSNLDRMLIWERSAIRAGLDLLFSQGFLRHYLTAPRVGTGSRMR